MSVETPVGWEQDSQTLFLHASGVRIERRVYRSKEGWVLVPVDLDEKVQEFSPDEPGLEKAFAAFSKGESKPEPSKVSPGIREAREAARIDEKPEEPSEDEEDDGEEADEASTGTNEST